MGLFSSKKTYVSSTIYNMAGPIEDRPNYLKTLLIGNVLGASTGSLPEQIRGAYGSGPGNRLRAFGRWAKDNYKEVGVGRANLYSQPQVSADAVGAQILKDPNQTVSVQRVDVGLGDYAFWAEQWMMEHEPDLLGSNWESDFNETTNTVTIRFADGGSVDFTPKDFRKSSAYITAVYTLITEAEVGPLVSGSLQELGDTDPFPSVAGWTVTSNVSENRTVMLPKITQKVSSFSDGRPDEAKTTTEIPEQTFNYYRAVYERSVYDGAELGSSQAETLKATRRVMRFYRDATVDEQTTTNTTTETLPDGVIKTTKTTVNENILVVSKAYQIDTQERSLQTISRPKMFIYRLGSGNPTLDKLVKQTQEDGYYLPFIPLRLDNKMLPQVSQAAYENTKDAYKRASSGDLDDLIDDLQGNKDLKDIDYAYVMFGVSLNTKEITGRRYLFDFFERIRLTASGVNYSQWAARQDSFASQQEQMNDWRQGQFNSGSAYYGEEPPVVSNTYSMPTSEIRIRGNGSLNTNMDIQISWSGIEKSTGTGLGRPGAKKGDCWINNGTSDAYAQTLLVGNQRLATSTRVANRVVIHRQVTSDRWEALTIIGLVHKNFIYKGKFVEIQGDEALKDTEESGFLIPLHYETFKAMSLIDSTQLSTACCYMVINSYVVKKTGFFGSAFFKIFLVVAVVAITVATGGAGAGGIGLLGSNIAVGTAVGLSGTLAIIAGAVANAVVAMIVSKIISAGAVLVFGEKLGAIIGAIASVAAIQVGSALTSGSNLAASIGNLARAENIIAMTNSVGSGVAGYIQAGAMETMGKIQDLQKEYAAESADITAQYEREFGYGRAMLDPLILTNRDQFAIEGPGAFLERTLMTGSDVADMSISLLSNFTDITLSTELPL